MAKAKKVTINFQPGKCVPETSPRRTKTRQRQEAVLTGHEEQVDEIIKAKKEMDDTQANYDGLRADIQGPAIQEWHRSETDGTFTKRVILRGSRRDCTMSFGNSFSKIDPRIESDMRQHLGPYFDRLFEIKETASAIPQQLDRLRNLIMDAGHDPDEFLEADSNIVVVEDFREKRFQLRGQMTAAQNAATDLVVSSAQYRPSLVVPK